MYLPRSRQTDTSPAHVTRPLLEAHGDKNLLKEALSTTVLCALLFLFFPRIQFIARPTFKWRLIRSLIELRWRGLMADSVTLDQDSEFR